MIIPTLRALALLAVSFSLSRVLSAQTVDDVIAKNAQARGGMDKLDPIA